MPIPSAASVYAYTACASAGSSAASANDASSASSARVSLADDAVCAGSAVTAAYANNDSPKSTLAANIRGPFRAFHSHTRSFKCF